MLASDQRRSELQFVTQIFRWKVSPAFRACVGFVLHVRARALEKLKSEYCSNWTVCFFYYFRKIYWREFNSLWGSGYYL